MRDPRLSQLSRAPLYAVYRGLTTSLAPLALVALRVRSAVGKEEPTWAHIRRRMGWWRDADTGLTCANAMPPEHVGHDVTPGGEQTRHTTLWFHGASVGESKAALPLVRRVIEKHNHTTATKTDAIGSMQYPSPKASVSPLRILLSVGTITGRTAIRDDVARMFPRDVPGDNVRRDNVRLDSANHSASALGYSDTVPSIHVVAPPLDIPNSVQGFLRHWQPNRVVFVESELWPNMIHEIASGVYYDRNATRHEREPVRQTRIPLALVNGKLSPRSFSRWQSCRPLQSLLGGMLTQFDAIVAQSDNDAARFIAAQENASDTPPENRVAVAPNLKLTQSALPISKESVARANSLFEAGARDSNGGSKGETSAAGLPVVRLVVASTHEGEEELVAKALAIRIGQRRAHKLSHQPYYRVSTVIAPRHPERVGTLAHHIRREFGLSVRIVPASFILNGHNIWETNSHRKSDYEAHSSEPDITLVEGVGALTALYACADLALVGGALLGGDRMVGQHNIIEPLQKACITLHGSHAQDDETFCSLWKSFLTYNIDEIELRNVLRPLRGSSANDIDTALEQACCDLQGDTLALESMHGTMARVTASMCGLDAHWTELEKGHFYGTVLGQ